MEFTFHFVLDIKPIYEDESVDRERALKFEGNIKCLQRYYRMFNHLASLKPEPENNITRFSNENCDMNAVWNLIGCPRCDYLELRTQVMKQLDQFKNFYAKLKTQCVPKLLPACEDAYPCSITCSFCPTQLWITEKGKEEDHNHVKVNDFRICYSCYFFYTNVVKSAI